jgi:transposase
VRQTFEIPLDIPDVTIENVTTNRLGHIEITVKSTIEGTPCHRCGKMTTKFYGEDREITLRHLPILGKKTSIRLRPRRYQCSTCQGHPTATQTLSWYILGRLKRPIGLAHFLGLLIGVPNPVTVDITGQNDGVQKPGNKFGPKTAFLDTLGIYRRVRIRVLMKNKFC